MKKYLIIMFVLGAALIANAAKPVYELSRFTVKGMSLYLATPPKAEAAIGAPLKKEGILNRRVTGYPYGGFSPWYGYYRYPMYYGYGWGYSSELLGTLVFLYQDAVIYFDQKTQGGDANITSMNIYTPDLPLYFGDQQIKIGEEFSIFQSLFPQEYAKAAKRADKRRVFDITIKVASGYDALKQKGKIIFIFENKSLAAIQVSLN